MIEFLSTKARIPTEITKDSRIVVELLKIMKQNMKNVKTRKIKVTTPKYFKVVPEVYKLLAYNAKPTIYYVLSYGSIIAGLYALYSYLTSGKKKGYKSKRR